MGENSAYRLLVPESEVELGDLHISSRADGRWEIQRADNRLRGTLPKLDGRVLKVEKGEEGAPSTWTLLDGQDRQLHLRVRSAEKRGRADLIWSTDQGDSVIAWAVPVP